jgi:hypothetical protein
LIVALVSGASDVPLHGIGWPDGDGPSQLSPPDGTSR